MKSFDIETVIESKREHRKELATKPVLEKLKMLDELRRRSRVIKAAKLIEPRHDAK